MTSVVIFGCGPAGLFAARAAQDAGAKVRIISKKRRSELFGAQYLHEPIPGVPTEQREIEYRLLGSFDGYRQRVYGGSYQGDTSVDEYIGHQEAWDIRATYNSLYDSLEDSIDNVKQMDGMLFKALVESRAFAEYDHIISSVPLPKLCLKPALHKFNSQRIWALGDAPERGQFVRLECPKDKVLCNGQEPDHPDKWYRLSNVFGYTTVEWPAWYYPGIGTPVAEVLKPINTTCDCHPTVKMIGRFGKWQKGVLSHHSYNEVMELIS